MPKLAHVKAYKLVLSDNFRVNWAVKHGEAIFSKSFSASLQSMHMGVKSAKEATSTIHKFNGKTDPEKGQNTLRF